MKDYTPEQADAMARYIKYVFSMCQDHVLNPFVLRMLNEGTAMDIEVYKEVQPFVFEVEEWV